MQEKNDVAYEHALAEAYAAGDDSALEVLFQRYYKRLCHDAQRYVSHDTAQDIVQDVFAALILKRTQWRVHSTVRKYLHAAVRNRARDLVARHTTERAWRDTSPSTPINLQSRQASSPEDEVLLCELETLLTTALTECSARVRQVLLLAEEYPRYADLGAHLGLSPGTVHTLLARGRRKIRRYLAEHGWAEVVHREHKRALLRFGRARNMATICTHQRLRQASSWPDLHNNSQDHPTFSHTD